jgi:hypothetical protein
VQYFYVHRDEGGVVSVELDAHVTHDIDDLVARGFTFYDTALRIEHVGQPLISGEIPWFVSVNENVSWRLERDRGMATYVIVEEGLGTFKIGNHNWVALAEFG